MIVLLQKVVSLANKGKIVRSRLRRRGVVSEALEILGSFGLVIANDGELLIVLLPAEAAEAKTRVIIDENIISPIASLKLASNSLYRKK